RSIFVANAVSICYKAVNHDSTVQGRAYDRLLGLHTDPPPCGGLGDRNWVHFAGKERRTMATASSRYSWLGVGLLAAALAACTSSGARADLFVPTQSGTSANSILQFDQNDASLLNAFVAPGLGGLSGPRGVLWGPDG